MTDEINDQGMDPEVTEVVESTTETNDTPESAIDFDDMDIKPAKVTDFEKALSLLMEGSARVIESLQDLRTTQLPGSSAHLAQYGESVKEAIPMHPLSDFDTSPTNVSGSVFSRNLENEGEVLTHMKSTPRIKAGELSGDAAAIRARAAANLGGQGMFMFPDSGLWLKIRTPSDSTLMELHRRVAMERISLGRSTLGASFTSTSIYTQFHLTNCILQHVIDGTAMDITPTNLKKVMYVTELPVLNWAFASMIWPDTYPLTQPCLANPSECTHITEAEINVRSLYKVNRRMFDTLQLNHMANRSAKHKNDVLETYRSHHKLTTRAIKVAEDTEMVLSVPTIEQYETSSFKWIDGIVQRADEAFGQELRGDARNTYITEQGNATKLRRLGHWVKEIRYTDSDSVVKDREAIESTLDIWSSNDDIQSIIKREVLKFTRDVQTQVIGFVRYKCPSCGGDTPDEASFTNLKEIVPIDVLSVFFTLLRKKITSLSEAGL